MSSRKRWVGVEWCVLGSVCFSEKNKSSKNGKEEEDDAEANITRYANYAPCVALLIILTRPFLSN